MWAITKKNDSVLMHHGIKGQKWGIRKFQNEDGTLTAEGKERYKNMMPTSAIRDANRAYVNGINNKLQYLYNNGYKTVSGRDLKGSSLSKGSISGQYRAFNTNGSVSFEAQKSVSGNGEEYDDRYPIFENPRMAAAFAKTLDELPEGSYERAMFEANPNIKRALYNTALQDIVLAGYAIPTSAQEAQEKARQKELEAKKKAEYEARMKANIPASAWNERQRALKK